MRRLTLCDAASFFALTGTAVVKCRRADLSVLDDLSVPQDMSVADLSRADWGPARLDQARHGVAGHERHQTSRPHQGSAQQKAQQRHFRLEHPEHHGGRRWRRRRYHHRAAPTGRSSTISGGFTQNIQDVWFPATDRLAGSSVPEPGVSVDQRRQQLAVENANLGGNLYSVFGTANDKVVELPVPNNKLYPLRHQLGQ